MWRISVLARSGLYRNLFFRVEQVDALVVDSALDRRLAGNECASPPLVGHGHYLAAAVQAIPTVEARMCLAELSGCIGLDPCDMRA